MLRTIYGDGLNVDILFGGDYIVQFFHEKGSIADTEDVHQNKYDFFYLLFIHNLSSTNRRVNSYQTEMPVWIHNMK